jgi:hypothetical protein
VHLPLLLLLLVGGSSAGVLEHRIHSLNKRTQHAQQ